MPTKYMITASIATPGVTFVELTLNGTDVPLAADNSNNFSGTKTMNLPNSFEGAVVVKTLLPTVWSLSLQVLTIPDATSVLQQNITGTIKDGQKLTGHWSGTLALSAPITSVQQPKPATPPSQIG